jgi:hypothetical protein
MADTASKARNVFLFLIIIYKQYFISVILPPSIFMVYIRIKFHFRSCNYLLIIAIILKAKETFAVSVLLIHILQNIALTNAAHTFNVYYRTSFENNDVTDTDFATPPPSRNVILCALLVANYRKRKKFGVEVLNNDVVDTPRFVKTGRLVAKL